MEATHEGFREKANIKVYDTEGWNPPSFAYGRIYVRNLDTIAAIDLGLRMGQLADPKR